MYLHCSAQQLVLSLLNMDGVISLDTGNSEMSVDHSGTRNLATLCTGTAPPFSLSGLSEYNFDLDSLRPIKTIVKCFMLASKAIPLNTLGRDRCVPPQFKQNTMIYVNNLCWERGAKMFSGLLVF